MEEVTLKTTLSAHLISLLKLMKLTKITCLTLFLSCQSIFIGSYLKLLKTLRHPLIHFQVFFHAVKGTFLLFGSNFSRREVGYAVDEANFGEFVVRG